jgi:hypothetical protein
VRLPRLHGQTYEAGAGVTVQKALPANRETRMETSKRELDYIRLGAYGGQQISERLKKTGSSDAGRSLPGLSEASIKVLFALSVVAILAAVFFFRRNGVTAVKAAGGVPMLGYQPWNPKVL